MDPAAVHPVMYAHLVFSVPLVVLPVLLLVLLEVTTQLPVPVKPVLFVLRGHTHPSVVIPPVLTALLAHTVPQVVHLSVQIALLVPIILLVAAQAMGRV